MTQISLENPDGKLWVSLDCGHSNRIDSTRVTKKYIWQCDQVFLRIKFHQSFQTSSSQYTFSLNPTSWSFSMISWSPQITWSLISDLIFIPCTAQLVHSTSSMSSSTCSIAKLCALVCNAKFRASYFDGNYLWWLPCHIPHIFLHLAL